MVGLLTTPSVPPVASTSPSLLKRVTFYKRDVKRLRKFSKRYKNGQNLAPRLVAHYQNPQKKVHDHILVSHLVVIRVPARQSPLIMDSFDPTCSNNQRVNKC